MLMPLSRKRMDNYLPGFYPKASLQVAPSSIVAREFSDVCGKSIASDEGRNFSLTTRSKESTDGI
jgi:hypothetical protein